MIDVKIIGGGIAGLWILHRLRTAGFDAVLFEREALGSGQTIASQGIIHGGAKYALGRGGPKSALAGMPELWRKCLSGYGEMDLRGCVVSCYHHLYSSSRRWDHRMIASVAAWRMGLIDDAFNEPVVDVRKVLQRFAEKYRDSIFLGNGVGVEAARTIYAAGAGNSARAPAQRRPLRMFMVRYAPYPIWGHVIAFSTKPRITITSHAVDGGWVWYLGGQVAEKAVGMSDSAALAWAKRELSAVMPHWQKIAGVEWAIHDIDRAEPVAGDKLPYRPTLRTDGFRAVAWPVKLALAPVLADEALEWIRATGLVSSVNRESRVAPNVPVPIAAYPWEDAKWTP